MSALEHTAEFYKDLLGRAEAEVDALKLRVAALEKARQDAILEINRLPWWHDAGLVERDAVLALLGRRIQ